MRNDQRREDDALSSGEACAHDALEASMEAGTRSILDIRKLSLCCRETLVTMFGGWPQLSDLTRGA